MPAVAACAACLLAGCAAVCSKEPFGGPPLRLEPAEWDGTWAVAETAVSARVKDSDGGVLRISWIEDSDGAFRLKTGEVHVRDGEDLLFLALKNDVGDDDRYYFARAKKGGDILTVWLPLFQAFRDDIVSGRLPGETNGAYTVTLGTIGTNELHRIASRDGRWMFAWDEPVTFRRLAGK